MYAIVEIAGQQFKVAKDQKVFVHRLQEEEGANVSFDKVLLLDNEGKITIGAPAIKGAEVTAKILSHLKGDKVIVFKKKRRKGYKKKNGHRQSFTEIQVEEILASGAKKKTETKAVTPEKAGAKAKVEKAKAVTPAKAKAVIPAKAATKSEEKVVSTDLTAMTVAQLKALAKDKGIKGYTSLKKAELIEALNK